MAGNTEQVLLAERDAGGRLPLGERYLPGSKLGQEEEGMNQKGESIERTRGQIEAEISEAVIKFEKEYMGRGPVETKTHILDDLVLVRLKGILTQAEYQLARTTNDPKGRELIKQVRHELLERGRPLLEAVIYDLTGRKTISLHTDISTLTGERVIIFTLDAPAELPLHMSR